MVAVNLSLSGIVGLSAMRAFLDPKGYHEAMRYGLRYASRAATTEAAKQIRSQYTISAARIKQDIKGPFLVNQDTEARLVFSRRPPTLLQYGFRPGSRGGPQPGRGRGMGWGKPQPKGRPATAKILRSGARIQYPNTFMVQGLPMTLRANGKLFVEHGPSIGAIFAGQSEFGDQIRSAVSARINEQLVKGVERKFGESARRFGGR